MKDTKFPGLSKEKLEMYETESLRKIDLKVKQYVIMNRRDIQ